MAELSIDPDYLRMLIVQVRGLMAKVPPELPNDGSNPTDDPIPPADLQDEEGDLTREEIVEEIRALEPRQQAELVALMWLGRDEGEALIGTILSIASATRRVEVRLAAASVFGILTAT